ncbi:hypothetical protein B0H10DRAFT_1962859 [Mycena sp. CBHHK59/15]|nr:hypothetical protein B0H10DRAFT_1962859 [Mycena sp. CBHHK59/15]
MSRATSKRCGAGRRLMTASWEEKNPKARGLFSSQETSHKEVLRIWVTNEYLPDLYLVLFEAQNNLAPPRSALQMNNPPTRTLIQQLKLTGSRGPGKLRPLWVLGTCGRGLATCDFCLGSGGLRSWPGKLRPLFGFWGLEVVAWQASTSVWASRGLRLWPGTLRLLFGFWGLEVVVWQTATSVWGASGSWPGKLRLLFGHQGAPGSSPGKLRPLFGFWGLDVVAWQAATSVWVLGEQIKIWPGQAQLLSGQSRMLWADGNRTTWPVFLPLSWLHHGKQSAKLFA